MGWGIVVGSCGFGGFEFSEYVLEVFFGFRFRGLRVRVCFLWTLFVRFVSFFFRVSRSYVVVEIVKICVRCVLKFDVKKLIFL